MCIQRWSKISEILPKSLIAYTLLTPFDNILPIICLRKINIHCVPFFRKNSGSTPIV